MLVLAVVLKMLLHLAIRSTAYGWFELWSTIATTFLHHSILFIFIDFKHGLMHLPMIYFHLYLAIVLLEIWITFLLNSNNIYIKRKPNCKCSNMIGLYKFFLISKISLKISERWQNTHLQQWLHWRKQSMSCTFFFLYISNTFHKRGKFLIKKKFLLLMQLSA